MPSIFDSKKRRFVNFEKFYGEVHDASKLTFTGQQCFVASLCDGKGLISIYYGIKDRVGEFPNKSEAIEWLTKRLKELGQPVVIVESN